MVQKIHPDYEVERLAIHWIDHDDNESFIECRYLKDDVEKVIAHYKKMKKIQEELDKEYENMAQAYKNIFKRCGLDTKMVQSDSGAIGGSVSHEFMVITDTDAGENDVFYCDDCDYSANSNHAVSTLPPAVVDGKEYFNKTEIQRRREGR